MVMILLQKYYFSGALPLPDAPWGTCGYRRRSGGEMLF